MTEAGPQLTTAQIMQMFALKLKNANPSAWDGFVEALDAYATEAAIALTQAPQDQILAQQGRAQQCISLLRLYRECHRAPRSTVPQEPAQ